MDLSLDGETLVYAGDDPVNNWSDPSGLCVKRLQRGLRRGRGGDLEE